MCNTEISNTEIQILFWSLIATIASMIIATIMNVIERNQSAKFNSINILKESLEKPFRENLINNFSYDVKACHYRVVSVTDDASSIKVSFDMISLTKISNRVSCFLGEISYLKFAIPFRYNRLNKKGEKIISFIEQEMLSCAIYAGNKREEWNTDKMLSREKAEKIYRKFSRKINCFYKAAFKIYKYGL